MTQSSLSKLKAVADTSLPNEMMNMVQIENVYRRYIK